MYIYQLKKRLLQKKLSCRMRETVKVKFTFLVQKFHFHMETILPPFPV